MVASRRFLAMVWLMLFGLGVSASAADVAIPRSPTRWATDTSNFLKPQTVASLDARLHAYQTKTGHQILVYVTPTTGDAPMEDWTVKAFRRWKVGRKGLDDGLILFVFPTDHKVRIEVGYGLEQTVPDATASRIIRETVTPKLRAGQPDAALVAGVDRILGTIGGEASRGSAAPPADASSSAADWAVVGIGWLVTLLLIAGIFVFVGRRPRREFVISGRLRHGRKGWFWSSVSSTWSARTAGFSGGGPSGGGGFSGGGGSSGGGGASGSW